MATAGGRTTRPSRACGARPFRYYAIRDKSERESKNERRKSVNSLAKSQLIGMIREEKLYVYKCTIHTVSTRTLYVFSPVRIVHHHHPSPCPIPGRTSNPPSLCVRTHPRPRPRPSPASATLWLRVKCRAPPPPLLLMVVAVDGRSAPAAGVTGAHRNMRTTVRFYCARIYIHSDRAPRGRGWGGGG